MSDIKVVNAPLLAQAVDVAPLFWEENGERVPFYYIQSTQMYVICYDVYSYDSVGNVRMQMVTSNSSVELQKRHREIMAVGRKFFTDLNNNGIVKL